MLINESIILSVVVATHNRAIYLQKVLESLTNQTLSQEKYEVIIIDNASTDQTPEIVDSYTKRLINLIYIYEANANLNEARNTGWKNAKGNYIIYIDDDAIAEPVWLENIHNVYIKENTDIIGGKILPLWEAPRPVWLHEKLLGALSIIDYSPTPVYLTNKYPFGVNMGFKKSSLKQIGGFNPKLDRQGTKLLSGGETAIIKQLQKTGCLIYYDPSICVSHHIHGSRLQQSWFTKRYYWGGYSDALMWRILEKPTIWQWFKKFGFYIYGFIRNPLDIFYLQKKTDNPEAFWFKCIVYARIGYIRGLFDLSKNS